MHVANQIDHVACGCFSSIDRPALPAKQQIQTTS